MLQWQEATAKVKNFLGYVEHITANDRIYPDADDYVSFVESMRELVHGNELSVEECSECAAEIAWHDAPCNYCDPSWDHDEDCSRYGVE